MRSYSSASAKGKKTTTNATTYVKKKRNAIWREHLRKDSGKCHLLSKENKFLSFSVLRALKLFYMSSSSAKPLEVASAQQSKVEKMLSIAGLPALVGAEQGASAFLLVVLFATSFFIE